LLISCILERGSVTNSRRNESGSSSHVELKFMLDFSESEMIPQATAVGLDSPGSSSYSAFAEIAPRVRCASGVAMTVGYAGSGLEFRR
jgi:hypothetical protein